MTRHFKTADYEATLELKVSLREMLPANHLARFMVDLIAQLDLTAIYARYGTRGGEPYAPEILLGLLVYGYATGVFSSRKIEQATFESAPFLFIAGNRHPDHDTLAHFRKTFLSELKELFVQGLLLAQTLGLLKLGNISLDGSKIHADASKSHAVSYKRLLELESQLRREVDELFALAEQADQPELPEGLIIADDIRLRQERLSRLAEAKAVLQARAQARDQAAQAAYETKVREREEHAQRQKRKPRGCPPKPPTPGPREQAQYNFTDPESRIMKNGNDAGFEQAYNTQAAVDHDSLLIVGYSLSNHTNDQAEVAPTLDAIPTGLGTPPAAALDCGYFSEANINALKARGLEPYIATGRDPHHKSWAQRFVEATVPPPDAASPQVHMAYKLQTKLGQAIYRLRKSTVEPVIGIIKEVMGFRQFSLRGLLAAAGEWCLVCLAFNLKRLHILDRG
jgi:transposase